MKMPVFHLALAVNLTFQAAAESNTTNVLDGVTTNAAGPFILGDTGPFNFLLITNGGALTNTFGTIGNSNAAFSNAAILTGAGSIWQSDPVITIGVRGASNQVSVLDGAKLGSSVVIGVGTYETSPGNRLLVSGIDSSLSADRLFLGTYSSHNELVAERGARVELNELTINSEQSAVGQNRAIFRGAGTTVSNTSVFIGGSPGNLVAISDGARFTGPSINLGTSFRASANHLDLSGAGTLVTLRSGLSVGQFGSNNLTTIEESATLLAGVVDIGTHSSGNRFLLSGAGRVVNMRIPNANASLVLGSSAGANGNLLLIENPGTIWSNSGYVFIGGSGSRNAMILSNGAAFSDNQAGFGGIIAGDSSSSFGNLLHLTGAGSMLNSRHGLTLGRSGSQNLLFQSQGARLVTASADIGQSCIARDNLAFITGAGTVWSNGQLQVGFCSTNNHLVVSNGAQVFAGLVRSSVQGGASNSFTVTGPGSLLRAAGDLIVGNSGAANSLLIADGGRIEGRRDRLGFSGSSNSAQLSGAGTMWSSTSFLLGDVGSENLLVIADGAGMESGEVVIGSDYRAARNRAFVGGEGVVWNIRTNLFVGGWGRSNSLSVLQGARVFAWDAVIGAYNNASSSGGSIATRNVVLVRDSNSLMQVAGNFHVGLQGPSNIVSIRDGGQIIDANGIIGGREGAIHNRALITGPGSSWLNTNSLIVGSNGLYSEMTVASGGRVISGNGYLGYSGVDLYGGSICYGALESFSRVTVTGPQSVWENRGALFVGYGAGGNQLIVNSGGTVLANGLTIGRVEGIRNGGSCPPVTNVVVIDGGCLVVTNADESATLETRFGTYRQQSGVAIIDVLTCTNGPFSRVELLGGTLRVKWGRIQNGSPLVIGDGLRNAQFVFAEPPYWGALKFRSDDGIVVQPHAWLSGVGTVDASVTNAGTISPGGAKPGSLGLTRLTCLSGSRLHIDIAGRLGEEWDYLGLSFGGTLDGFLTVALRNGFVPSASDTFRILSGTAPFSGGFANAPFGSRLKTADSLGSFLVISNANRIELRDHQSTDLDGDGIEDAWATNRFGHSPLTPAEKLADADGDGVSNYDEFKAGTDPNDPASALRLSIAYAGDRATVLFPCVEGKEYRIWTSSNLETWTEVTDPTFAYPSPSRCEWADDGKDTGGLGAASRFYRLSVE